VLEQHAGHDRSQREADHRRDAENGDGPGALGGVEEDDDRGHRQRDEDGGTDTEQRPRRDEAAGARRQRAPERPGEEHDQADHGRSLPPVSVTEQPRRQQQCTERQQVAVGEPLELGAGRVQAHGDVRQGDVEDRRVEADDEHGRRRRGKGPPAPRVSSNMDLTSV
jgi:hypothetical protein